MASLYARKARASRYAADANSSGLAYELAADGTLVRRRSRGWGHVGQGAFLTLRPTGKYWKPEWEHIAVIAPIFPVYGKSLDFWNQRRGMRAVTWARKKYMMCAMEDILNRGRYADDRVIYFTYLNGMTFFQKVCTELDMWMHYDRDGVTMEEVGAWYSQYRQAHAATKPSELSAPLFQ